MKDPPFKELEIDIENAPYLGWYFSDKQPYCIVEVLRPSFLYSIAWKWRGEKKIECKTLADFKTYKNDKYDDRELVKFAHSLIAKSDCVIGHNGDNFDIKVLNSRFIFHRLEPTPPYKSRDTLKISRRLTKQHSHRLDALAQFYGIGRKLPHTGKHLWLACYNGDMSAWPIMAKYNKHDVYLMDELLNILDPWDNRAINRNLCTRTNGCSHCGSKQLQKAGYKYVKKGYKQRYLCLTCHSYSTDDTIEPLGKVRLSPSSA